MLTLHYAPRTCALASLIALEDSGAEFETVRLDLASGDQRSDAFLKLNPKGRVPALVTPRGVLTETPAILAFIAQSFPAAGLAPLDDPFAFAQLQAFNSYLCSTVHIAHAHRVRGPRWASDPASFYDMKRKVPANMTASFQLIENDYLVGPWVLGEHYSVADPYLFAMASWLEGDGVDIQSFPGVAAHFERMQARDAVKRALARDPA